MRTSAVTTRCERDEWRFMSVQPLARRAAANATRPSTSDTVVTTWHMGARRKRSTSSARRLNT